MTEEKTYTQKQIAEILERQALVYALDHAIQRGKLSGDSPEFLNPLINWYNALTAPPAPVKQPAPKEDDEPEEEIGNK